MKVKSFVSDAAPLVIVALSVTAAFVVVGKAGRVMAPEVPVIAILFPVSDVSVQEIVDPFDPEIGSVTFCVTLEALSAPT